MKNDLSPKEEQNATRCESIKESQKRGVFVDEFGGENPAVAVGSCKPATKGVLAEPEKRKLAVDFIDGIAVKFSEEFVRMFRMLEKKYNRVIALQFIDDEFGDYVKKVFGLVIDTQIPLIHTLSGEEKSTQLDDDIRDQIGTPDGQYSPYKEKVLCDNCGSKIIRNGTCIKCLNCGESIGCS